MTHKNYPSFGYAAVLALMLVKGFLNFHMDLLHTMFNLFSGHLVSPFANAGANVSRRELLFLEHYDVIFANDANFYTLLAAVLLCLGLVLFLLAQANLLNLSFYPNATFDSEKYSPYECGFTPFRTERAQFDIKFYLVALLFLVFDVELMFLLPYAMSYNYLGIVGYLIFIIFFTLLVLGFLVEWSAGMLVWKNEENSPANLQLIPHLNFEFKKKAIKYFSFVKLYLRIFDQKFFSRIFKKITKTPRNFRIRKIKFKRPYHFWYYNVEPVDFFPREILDFVDYDNALVLIRSGIPFQGAATTSITTELLWIEKQKKQERIEWFFTTVYGERYVNWLNTLSPEERDFTLE